MDADHLRWLLWLNVSCGLASLRFDFLALGNVVSIGKAELSINLLVVGG